MDPEQSNQQGATPSMTQQGSAPPVQDVNATATPQGQGSPMTQGAQAQQTPIETPIETPVDTNIQIEGYEPPPSEVSTAMPPPPPTGGFNKRVLIIIGAALFIVIILILLLFLALRPKEEVEQVVLTYWGLWEDPVVMQSVIDDYQAQNPNVTIQYSNQSPKEYRQRLQAAIGRGEGPDIFRYHNTWVPMLFKELAPIPPEVMSPEEYIETFYPVTQIDLAVNNQFVGIPLMIDGLVMYYNAQLLDEAGVAIPETWEDFEQAVQTMTIKDEQGNIELAGAALGLANNVEHFSDIIGLILYQNSADPTSPTMPSFSSGNAVAALEYYTLFAAPPNNVWDATQDSSIVAFASGNVAFVFAPTWQAHVIQTLNPDLVFGVASVPQLKGAAPVNWASYWVEGVSSGSPNQIHAYTFLKYLSSKEVMTKLFAEASKMRAFGSPYSRVDLADELRSNNLLAPIADEAPTMRSWYLASRTQDEGINDWINGYMLNAVNAIADGSSAEGELTTVNWGVNDILGGFGVAPP